MAAKRSLEEDPIRFNQNSSQARKNQPAKDDIRWLLDNPCQKGGSVTGHGGFRKISGARTRVAVGQSGFPVSIRTSPANVHDSTKSADVMENISEFMDDDGTIKQIASVYADKKGGYDSTAIRSYLKNRNPIARIPFRKNGKSSERINHTKNIIRFDALRRDSLVGSKTDFTGQESDMKRDVKTVLRLLVLDHF